MLIHGVHFPNDLANKTRVYVASSWRNVAIYPVVVEAIRAMGFQVYDFKNPGEGKRGFSWGEVARSWGQPDEHWKKWTKQEYLDALETPIAQHGFKNDMEALQACDICVLVLPCGRSAHLEAGWATGAGKKTLVLWAEGEEAELMNKMHHKVCGSIDELLYELGHLVLQTPEAPSSPTALDEALRAVRDEVIEQDRKWGPENDALHEPATWIAILAGRLGKLFESMEARRFRSFKEEWHKRLVQVAAVAVSAIVAAEDNHDED